MFYRLPEGATSWPPITRKRVVLLGSSSIFSAQMVSPNTSRRFSACHRCGVFILRGQSRRIRIACGIYPGRPGQVGQIDVKPLMALGERLGMRINFLDSGEVRRAAQAVADVWAMQFRHKPSRAFAATDRATFPPRLRWNFRPAQPHIRPCPPPLCGIHHLSSCMPVSSPRCRNASTPLLRKRYPCGPRYATVKGSSMDRHSDMISVNSRTTCSFASGPGIQFA